MLWAGRATHTNDGMRGYKSPIVIQLGVMPPLVCRSNDGIPGGRFIPVAPLIPEKMGIESRAVGLSQYVYSLRI
jgi:hypothetical protein